MCKLDIKAAIQDGFEVFKSTNGVVLTDDVPLDYLTCVRLLDGNRDMCAGTAWPTPPELEEAAAELRQHVAHCK